MFINYIKKFYLIKIINGCEFHYSNIYQSIFDKKFISQISRLSNIIKII